MNTNESAAEAALRQALAAANTVYQSQASHTSNHPALTLLCEMAAAADLTWARAGANALFAALIERLNDSFEPASCERYDQLFIQVIEFFRRLPAARAFDETLHRFGLHQASDLRLRKQHLAVRARPVLTQPIQKILLLSRVTIGADVALNGALIATLRQRFSRAEFVLLGSAKLRELFGGDEQVRVRELSYERGGTVLTRLNSWLAVVAAVEEELRDCGTNEFLVLDPDSRLTQLGLLPIMPADRNYFFFESRRYHHESDWSLARLAAQWCAEVFDIGTPCPPQLSLPPVERDFGQAVVERLRQTSQRLCVSLSFGVGGNLSKQLGEKFEAGLLDHLVKDAVLLLDKGGTPEERAQVDRLLAPLRAAGHTILELNASNAVANLASISPATSIITWDGGIGAFAGLVAASDQYIGYDSAGQHLAAALGVPVLTIFVSDNGARFAARWQAYGQSLSKVYQTAPLGHTEAKTTQLALAEVWQLYQSFKQAGDSK